MKCFNNLTDKKKIYIYIYIWLKLVYYYKVTATGRRAS